MVEGQDQCHDQGSRAGSGQGWGLRSGTRLRSSSGEGQGQGVKGGCHGWGLGVGARGAVGFSWGVQMKRNVPDIIPFHSSPFHSNPFHSMSIHSNPCFTQCRSALS